MKPQALATSQCTPCRGGIPPLTPAEAAEYLEQLPNWEPADGATWIQRTFPFPDFRAALAFVQRIGEVAEAVDHHPVINFGWGFCTVKLQTMKIKGLHLNDFILAAKIDDVMRTGTPPC